MLDTLLIRRVDTPVHVLVLRLPSGRRHTVGSAPPHDDGSGPDWASFRPHGSFLRALHEYLSGGAQRSIPELDDCDVSPFDRVVVVDERAGSVHGTVPAQDVVGSYQANASGRPRLSSFEPNPRHRLVTATGEPSSWLRNEGFLAFLDQSHAHERHAAC